MLKINKQTITLTKGDDASLRLVPRYKDKTEYVLTEGDSAVFRIKFGHTLVELECTLNLETNKIVANITPNDTKDFNPGIYRYEAELITSFGFHYTFIADQTFILGQEYEQRITSTSNGNSSAVGGNLPEIDGIVDGEPVVYGDIQPTNPMMDYEELNHLPKLNGKTIKGDKDNEYYGIPTKTSDLENDSDFVSDDDYVHTDNNFDDTAKNAVDALGTASTYDVPESGNASTSQVVKGDDTRLTDSRNPNPHTHSKADITDFPTNVSAFNNDSGFITNTVNNLANYYLKSETYTRAEVEQLIAAIKQGKFEIVAELPASGDANVIYLVPKSTAQTSNSYDEYVYINNAWEKIGDTDIDLSGYVTDDELTTALQSYLTTSAFNTAIASYYTKTETDNLLANKVDKVAGKGLSTNDYDNTAKGIVDGVTSALNDKVDKVQGKGLSTNDYDNTAKGIVDGVTSALADKVDKVNGKGLSTEDYTTAEKSKLGGISDNAKKVASSSTNGHIEIDDVDTTVYDDTAVQTAIENIEDELSTDYATVEGNPINFSTLSAQKSKSTILSVEPIQDLHGYDKPWVGGAGKNKFNIDDYYSKTAKIDISDDKINFINSNYSPVIYNFDLEQGKTYTISFDVTIQSGGAYSKARYVDDTSSNLYVSSINETTQNLTYTFTVTRNETIRIEFSGKGATDTGYYSNIMLEEGSQPTTFAPYKNECPISGRTEIGILGCGKNLYVGSPSFDGYKDISNWTKETETYNGHDVYSNIAAWSGMYKSIDLEAGTYTFSCRVKASANNTKAFVYNRGSSGALASKTIGTSWDIIKCAFTLSEAVTNNHLRVETNSGKIYVSEYQLEKASDYTTYEPYTESNDLTISLGQTVYGCHYSVENGVLVVDNTRPNVEDLTWTYESGVNSMTTETLSNLKSPASDTEAANVITSFSKVIPSSQRTSDTTPFRTFVFANNQKIYVRDSGYTDANAFVSALTRQTICYELATPITIQLTPQTIKLLEGVNNISTDGDKITLTYRDGKVATLGDLTSAVDNLDSKIDESKILTDTATGDKYILVVTNGVLSVEQVSN